MGIKSFPIKKQRVLKEDPLPTGRHPDPHILYDKFGTSVNYFLKFLLKFYLIPFFADPIDFFDRYTTRGLSIMGNPIFGRRVVPLFVR